MPNFVEIASTVAEISRFCDISRWRAIVRGMDVRGVIVRTPLYHTCYAGFDEENICQFYDSNSMKTPWDSLRNPKEFP